MNSSMISVVFVRKISNFLTLRMVSFHQLSPVNVQLISLSRYTDFPKMRINFFFFAILFNHLFFVRLVMHLLYVKPKFIVKCRYSVNLYLSSEFHIYFH